MEIYVTQEDIDNGVAFDTARCPIANALWRLLPDSLLILVSPHWVRIRFAGETRRQYTLPEEATRFIFDFDRNKPVHPLSFTL